MKPPPNETVEQRQARFNRSTQSHWLHFAPHRARVLELVLAGRELTPGGRFCALGAGNCNDLELRRLVDAFDEVHLVDLDPVALQSAVERQGLAGSSAIRLHAPVDLTGIAPIVSTWKANPPRLPDVRRAVEVSANAVTPDLTGPFDVVLSSCVLSQIVGYATDVLGGDRHPGFRELVIAIRTRHLRLMTELLKPGGTGILVCDLVSSDSLDHLPRIPSHELGGLIEKLAKDGNFFSGLFPEALLTTLRTDPVLKSSVDDVRPLAPWHWRLGPLRTFLVYAVRFRRTAGVNLFVKWSGS